MFSRRGELRVPGGLTVIVSMDVDEARRDEQPVGIDLATNEPTPQALREAVRAVLDEPRFRLRAAQLAIDSGQAMLSLLKDLEKNDAEILLLDEWDANLSDENCLSQERLIERLAETRLVIEIRHGRKNS